MEINFIAVLVAALIPMILGFIWYHKNVFGNAWMSGAGLTEEKLQTGNMAITFGLAFVMSALIAFVMNIIAYHDAFINGAMYYATKDTGGIPAAGSELAKWFDYYKTNLADSNHTFTHGAFHGMMIGGLFLALPMTVVNGLFERRSFKYMAINGVFWIVCLALMGGIIAAWR